MFVESFGIGRGMTAIKPQLLNCRECRRAWIYSSKAQAGSGSDWRDEICPQCGSGRWVIKFEMFGLDMFDPGHPNNQALKTLTHRVAELEQLQALTKRAIDTASSPSPSSSGPPGPIAARELKRLAAEFTTASTQCTLLAAEFIQGATRLEALLSWWKE
jgi:hypothetical protein